MPVIHLTTRIHEIRKIRIRQLRRRQKLDRYESGLAIFRGKVIGEEEIRARMVRIFHWILQTTSAEPRMRHAPPRWCDARDLIHDLPRSLEWCGQPDAVGELDENLQITARIARRIDRLVHELNATLGVHHRSRLLRERSAR